MPPADTSRSPLAAVIAGRGRSSYEECEHIVHDDDPDTALCGVDQTDVPWDQGLPVCQACLAVAQGRMN